MRVRFGASRLLCRIRRATFQQLTVESVLCIVRALRRRRCPLSAKQIRESSCSLNASSPVRHSFASIGVHSRSTISSAHNQHREKIETQRTQRPQRNESNNACASAIVNAANLVNEIEQRLRIRSGGRLTIRNQSKQTARQPSKSACRPRTISIGKKLKHRGRKDRRETNQTTHAHQPL